MREFADDRLIAEPPPCAECGRETEQCLTCMALYCIYCFECECCRDCGEAPDNCRCLD